MTACQPSEYSQWAFSLSHDWIIKIRNLICALQCDYSNWNHQTRRQRPRHQTKSLMSKTIAEHVCYESLYINFLSCPPQNNYVKWPSSVYFGECEWPQLIFCILIWNSTLAFTHLEWASSETDSCTEQIYTAVKFNDKIYNYFLLDIISGVAFVVS